MPWLIFVTFAAYDISQSAAFFVDNLHLKSGGAVRLTQNKSSLCPVDILQNGAVLTQRRQIVE